MSMHDGAPLLAKTIHLRAHHGLADVQLTNGETIVWAGLGALDVGRQLAESVKAGRIRTLLVPTPDGKIRQVNVGPDVTIMKENGAPENGRG